MSPYFPTPLLDTALAKQQADQESTRQLLLKSALDWLQAEGLSFGIDRGYIFGSLTQSGRFTQNSDVDLAVETLNQGDPFGLISFLSTHVNREVDLVPLDQCHFADKIRQEGILWIASNGPD
ncbi:MAG: nucleotidyltransferase domain-containing protein [Leptolyngbyaceae bacterium]|nr:nucleotidyltransferase domain-containing protein [Leptolyngbyaceae bacterium]